MRLFAGIWSMLFLSLSTALAENTPPATVTNGVEASVYRCPKPDEKWVDEEQPILIRFYNPETRNSLYSSLINARVISSTNGEVDGNWVLGADHKTWRFKADRLYSAEDTITITALFDVDIRQTQLEWSFTTVAVLTMAERERIQRFEEDEYDGSGLVTGGEKAASVQSLGQNQIEYQDLTSEYDLPFTLPHGSVYYTEGRAPGNIFVSIFDRYDDTKKSHQLVLRDGVEIAFCKRNHNGIQTFFAHDDFGLVSWAQTIGHHITDTLWQEPEVCPLDSGYAMDAHDLQIVGEGHLFLLGREYITMDLSALAEDGNPEATVVGTVVQELDADRELVFQWRSVADTSLKILDAIASVTPDLETVDYMHSNTIDVQADGNLLVSVRNQNMVLNLDYTSGEILWRLGGFRSNFVFHNESLPFSMQHDARIIENGNLLLFDNGGYNRNYARAVEYSLDESNMIAEKVWEYDHDQTITSWSRGNARRLANGNTLIGWGNTSENDDPNATEIDEAGNIVWEIFFDGPTDEFTISYQYDHSTMMICPLAPIIDLDINDEGEAYLFFAKFNDDQVAGYRVYSDDISPPINVFAETIETSIEMSQEIMPTGAVYFMVTAVYDDGSESPPSDILRFDPSIHDAAEENGIPLDFVLTLDSWPNPFNDRAMIIISLSEKSAFTLEIYNLLGRKVLSERLGVLNAGKHSVTLNAQQWSSGVYLLRISNDVGLVQSRKIVLVR